MLVYLTASIKHNIILLILLPIIMKPAIRTRRGLWWLTRNRRASRRLEEEHGRWRLRKSTSPLHNLRKKRHTHSCSLFPVIAAAELVPPTSLAKENHTTQSEIPLCSIRFESSRVLHCATSVCYGLLFVWTLDGKHQQRGAMVLVFSQFRHTGALNVTSGSFPSSPDRI